MAYLVLVCKGNYKEIKEMIKEIIELAVKNRELLCDNSGKCIRQFIVGDNDPRTVSVDLSAALHDYPDLISEVYKGIDGKWIMLVRGYTHREVELTAESIKFRAEQEEADRLRIAESMKESLTDPVILEFLGLDDEIVDLEQVNTLLVEMARNDMDKFRKFTQYCVNNKYLLIDKFLKDNVKLSREIIQIFKTKIEEEK